MHVISHFRTNKIKRKNRIIHTEILKERLLEVDTFSFTSKD